MREIKFRGKKFNGDWIYGSLLLTEESAAIFPKTADDSFDNYLVAEETVGQYSGLKDKNGVDIYEGDILKGDNSVVYQVCFDRASFVARTIAGFEGDSTFNLGDFQLTSICIIGNIHDNPELLNQPPHSVNRGGLN